MRKIWAKAGAVALMTLLISGCGNAAGNDKEESEKKNVETTPVITKEYEDSDSMGLNPILPLYEYIPDGEPHVFGDRVYLYGSHDKFEGNTFCMNDYVVYSADVEDLENWKFEGVSYSRTQDPRYKEENNKTDYLYAPDVTQGTDGRYYLYYCLEPHPEIGVAVADNPAGPFTYYGLVQHTDGTPLGQKETDMKQFDPAALVDDDGSVWLYSGNSSFRSTKPSNKQASQVMELESDMLTLKTEPKRLICGKAESAGTGFEGHEFFEASSIRKIEDTYYMIYSSVNKHELCYATSKYPDKDFEYGGVLVSNRDMFDEDDVPMNKNGNNHGSMECINGQWYIFYHRHTNGTSYSRQACAERLYINEDGSIPQVEITTTGLSAISGKTTDWISGGRACALAGNYRRTEGEVSDEGAMPCVTQLGKDREDTPYSVVKSVEDYSLVGFKYFNCDGLRSITVSVSGDFKGVLEILDDKDGTPKGSIVIEAGDDWAEFTGEVADMAGDSAVYFWAKGEGSLFFEKFKMNYE